MSCHGQKQEKILSQSAWKGKGSKQFSKFMIYLCLRTSHCNIDFAEKHFDENNIIFQSAERPSLIPRLISHRKQSKHHDPEEKLEKCEMVIVNTIDPVKDQKGLKEELRLLRELTMNQVNMQLFCCIETLLQPPCNVWKWKKRIPKFVLYE